MCFIKKILSHEPLIVKSKVTQGQTDFSREVVIDIISADCENRLFLHKQYICHYFFLVHIQFGNERFLNLVLVDKLLIC